MALVLAMQTQLAIAPSALWEKLRDIDGLCAREPYAKLSLQRSAGEGLLDLGAEWQIAAEFAGQTHRGQMVVDEYRAPHGYRLVALFDLAEITWDLSLAPQGAGQCQTQISLAARPRSFQGRLLFKPAQMMQPMLQSKFQNRMRALLARLVATG
ncbi:MAG: hypothetical protein OIF40_09835 [Mangrovicoccus sp.]|nr:hypothetical protein [Mangrovicoccus sp.]